MHTPQKHVYEVRRSRWARPVRAWASCSLQCYRLYDCVTARCLTESMPTYQAEAEDVDFTPTADLKTWYARHACHAESIHVV